MEFTRKLKRLPKIDVYQDSQQEWRWRIIAENNKIIGASSEGYSSKENCVKNLRLVEEAIAQVTGATQ